MGDENLYIKQQWCWAEGHGVEPKLWSEHPISLGEKRIAQLSPN